jgi:hypothetical protein
LPPPFGDLTGVANVSDVADVTDAAGGACARALERNSKVPLLSLMDSNPETVRQLTIEQVVATAGDGRLRDGTESQRELREFLRRVTIDALATYADYCLSNSFPKGGQVLQDLVNELGRRLEYDVINGRYQGTTGAVGNDGMWRDPSGHGLVVEVKTTDAYRLSLDTVAKYRDQLMAAGTLARPCSILIVVGRSDTGELEAQVRGSRHAWDIRLISVEALLNLVRIKENADSQETVAKIRRLLTPLEFTRLDDLVDVVFTTTQDVETAITAETGEPLAHESRTEAPTKSAWGFTPSTVIQNIRNDIVAALAQRLRCSLIKRSRVLYWDPSRATRVACTISKRYEKSGPVKYWYAYHPPWHSFLTEAEHGFFVLGCTDLNVAFSLPVAVISSHLKDFHVSETRDGESQYYHIKIVESGAGRYGLQLPRSGDALPLEPYVLRLTRISP